MRASNGEERGMASGTTSEEIIGTASIETMPAILLRRPALHNA
jgi:hypothetical protein